MRQLRFDSELEDFVSDFDDDVSPELAAVGFSLLDLSPLDLSDPVRAFARRFVGGGMLLVFVAAIVGLIKAGALEHDRGAGADQSPQLRPAAFGALPLHRIVDRLKQFELVAAGVADVIVGWHRGSRVRRSEVGGRRSGRDSGERFADF